MKFDLVTPFVWVTFIFPVCVHNTCLFLSKIGKNVPKILCEKFQEIIPTFPEIFRYFRVCFHH